MKLLLSLRLLVIASRMFAADVLLSLEDATQIAKRRINNDNLPADHLVIHLIDFAQDRPPFYSVYFDPQIPDPAEQKENRSIGYSIAMDGTIRRSVIAIERVRVKAPFAAEAHLSPTRTFVSELLNQPFQLRLNTAAHGTSATP